MSKKYKMSSEDYHDMQDSQLYDEFEQYINLDDTKDKYKTLKKDNIIVINSKDRNLTIDTNYNFSINFNSINSNSLNISTNFKNIVAVEFLKLIIPNIYLDITEVLSLYNKGLINATSNTKRFMRISDLPYLLLHINEIKNRDTFGSNNNINKSSFILIMDDKVDKTNTNSGNITIDSTTFSEHGNLNNTIVGGMDTRLMILKDLACNAINYYASPQSYLSNLEISITTPEGKVISNLNNYLECSTIKSDNITPSSATKLIITCSKFLCGDEYSIGDKIIFKDILVSDNTYSDLKNFLLKEDGHSILQLGGKGSGTTKLYSEIHIPYEFIIDLSVSNNADGNSTIKNNFNLDSTGISFISGKILNLSLQTMFALQITTEERDESKLHANII